MKKRKMVDPWKSAFLRFEIKTFKRIVFIFNFVLALKTIDSQNLFRSVFFESAQKKNNRTFVHLLLLKRNQNQNTKKNNFCGVFLQNQKWAFWGPTFFKTLISYLFSVFFFIANVHKKILIFGPLAIFLKINTLTRIRWFAVHATKNFDLDF